LGVLNKGLQGAELSEMQARGLVCLLVRNADVTALCAGLDGPTKYAVPVMRPDTAVSSSPRNSPLIAPAIK